ncbi:hypothetical protein C8R47DRAFT_996725, partial [Mycena vitilis]
AKLRPRQVSYWINRARKSTPAIEDATAFGEEWWGWWIDINPSWRKTVLPMGRVDGSWTYIDYPGQNGFLNVLMCLKWWRDTAGATGRWIEGVKDVVWVLQKMNG